MKTDLQTLQQFLTKLNQFSVPFNQKKIESDKVSCKNIFSRITEIQREVEKHQRENATGFNVFNNMIARYLRRIHQSINKQPFKISKDLYFR